MNLSAPFIRRPIATILLTAGLALAGLGAFFILPVAPLPQVELPVISVSATLPGASPTVMATSIATPLERRLGVIAGVNELTSTSTTGSTHVTLQFDLSRNIDGAAREVQAAINAARADLPSTLRQNPTYQKRNPADAPVIILALTSSTKTPGQIYDAVSNIVEQRLSQVQGVGAVELGGASLPAVRVELSPFALNRFGVALEDVRAAIQSANANRPKGLVQDQGRRLQIYTSTGGRTAADYKPLIVAWRNNGPVRLQDVADVQDSVQDLHTLGLYNGQPAVIVLLTQQPGANVIQTVNSVRAVLPLLSAQLPPDIQLHVASDSTTSIRASLHEIEITLVIAVILVVIVVSIFLRSVRATVIPAVATIVSLMGTFGAMYLLGFSLNNLSLMALTVAAGFVVDDAIVVLENTSRHIEAGMDRFEAALLGAREVGFTVLSISVSLVAVFIPLLFMGGLVGRLFREFAVTLSAAVMISLVISLTTTPMMCAFLLRRHSGPQRQNPFARAFATGFDRVLAAYAKCLDWALAEKPIMLLILVAAIGLTAYLFGVIPKGFFPQQDSGRLNGGLMADQAISSQEMGQKLRQLAGIIGRDPAVESVVGFTGGSRPGGGFVAVQLKPVSQRNVTGSKVIARLRPKLMRVPGISLFLNPQQDIRTGGRSSNATYQYTLKSESAQDLRTWSVKLANQLKTDRRLTDVNTDQQDNGIETFVNVDRDTAGRLGVGMNDVDNALYDNFGQRQVATIYQDLNQYAVVLESAPIYTRDPNALGMVWVPASGTALNGGATASSGGLLGSGAAAANAAASASSNGATTQASSYNNGLIGSGARAANAAGLAAFGANSGATAQGTGLAGRAGGGSTNTSTAASGASATSSTSGNVSSTTAIGTSGSAAGTSTTTGSGAGSTGGGASATGSNLNSAAANPALRDQATGSAINTQARRMIPLLSMSGVQLRSVPAAVNHQDIDLATTISFNLAPGASLSQARSAIDQAEAAIGMPTTVIGSFQGTAREFQQSSAQEPVLILVALVAIYIVLGVLYESLVHPITVLSTLPSAGVGAVLALIIFHMEFSIIALIGVFLLIGIVKKNAIMIIDFALDAQRSRNLSAEDAVREACLLRFRPILMTTLAAGLGALPLAIGFGEGSELRQPLGVTIIGGLIASQLLTLLTTPVVYVYLDRFRRRGDQRHLARILGSGEANPA